MLYWPADELLDIQQLILAQVSGIYRFGRSSRELRDLRRCVRSDVYMKVSKSNVKGTVTQIPGRGRPTDELGVKREMQISVL